MKPREYCCCAIPIVNAGIYTALTEQLVAGIVVGALALFTPDIVGAATPSFAAWVFGIVSIAAGLVQILGFVAVAKEKSILFRRFLSLHILLLLAVFSLGGAWTIWSAVRHNDAKSDCVADFYDTSDPDEVDQADTLCTIFPWVDVGIMGGLWALFAIVHIYLYIVLSSYSKGQVQDHAKYDALNDSARAFNDSFPMSSRGDAWNGPPSADIAATGGYDYQAAHRRQNSSISMSDVMSQPVRRATDEYSDYSHRQTYPPEVAHTMDEYATPKHSETFYGGPSPHGEKPANAYAHPAEGSFRRKTPRSEQQPWGFN